MLSLRVLSSFIRRGSEVRSKSSSFSLFLRSANSFSMVLCAVSRVRILKVCVAVVSKKKVFEYG